MKDVISILQSRIAKRLKEFSKLTNRAYAYEDMFGRTIYNHVRDGLPPNHPDVVALAKQQKEDKRILAEIVKLRRVAKIVKRQEAIMVALDSVYEPAKIELPKDFVELIRLGER